MTLAYLCIVIAMIMPYVFAGLAKSKFRKSDNNTPRDYLAKLKGWRQRAHWAQQNSFESFPAFAAAVIVAHLTGGAQTLIDSLAIAFLVARVLYGIAYLTDKATLRSLCWTAGLLCVLGLFFSCYF